MKPSEMIPCATYEIRFTGEYECNHYKGRGIYLKSEIWDIDNQKIEWMGTFLIPDDEDPCYFPLDDVFYAHD